MIKCVSSQRNNLTINISLRARFSCQHKLLFSELIYDKHSNSTRKYKIITGNRRTEVVFLREVLDVKVRPSWTQGTCNVGRCKTQFRFLKLYLPALLEDQEHVSMRTCNQRTDDVKLEATTTRRSHTTCRTKPCKRAHTPNMPYHE